MSLSAMRVYLDHNAGAPLRPAARAAVAAALEARGNPSSAHREGAAARQVLEQARRQVAGLIGARAADLVFTSGATEANNLALTGLLAAGDLLVTTAIEHASVLEPATALEAGGVRVRRLGVRSDATLAPGELAAACAAGPRLVSVAIANGEVGVVHDVAAIARDAHAVGALVHTDAAQAAGRVPLDVGRLGVDLLSLSGHKLGAPAGCGALWIRPGLPLRPLLTGGPQERARRAGTENLLGIVGFGAAAEAARTEGTAATDRMRQGRDLLWGLLQSGVPGLERNGAPWEMTLPNTLNVSVPGVAGESLLVLLDLGGVAASLGSACAAGSAEPSHVLRAMGADEQRARGGLRLSLGPDSSEDEVGRAARVIVDAIAQIRRERAA
jgi:cysteine desulfurase